MPSLRIVYDNAADRGTLTAGSAAISQLNLITDSKTEIWRTAAATTTSWVAASWTNLEPIDCVAFPFCNFSPTATMKVTCYSDTAGTAQIYTTGFLSCTPPTAAKVFGMTAIQATSAYAYGGGTTARLYFPVQQCRKVVVDIVDASNLQGYLEASRLVMGDYFETKYNAAYGDVSVTYEDTSKNFRSDAGNLLSDVGTRNKKLSVNLAVLLPADRANLWKLVSYVGTSVPVFMSVFADNVDKDLEQAYSVYGKITSMSAIAASNYNIYSAPLEVEGV